MSRLPFRLRHADRLVAAFLLAVTAVVAAALFLVVESQGLFKARREYKTIFKDGGGLRPESPVRIAGIEVGSIRRVTLTPQDEVEVVFDVLEEYADRVRADPLDGSCAKVGTGSMMDSEEVRDADTALRKRCGSRVAASVPAGLGSFLPTSSGLVLLVGNRENPVIPAGGFVPAEQPEGIGELLAKLQKEGIVQTARDIVHQVDAVLRMVNDAEGPVQKTLAHVEEVTARAAEGKGLVGEITRDDSATQRRVTASLETLQKALAELEASSANIEAVTSGIAGRSEDIQQVVDRLQQFSEDASMTGKDLSAFAKDAKNVPPDVRAAVKNLNARIDDLGAIISGLKQSFPFNLVAEKPGEPAPKKPPPTK